MDNGSSIVWDLVTQRSLSLRTLFGALGGHSKPAFAF